MDKIHNITLSLTKKQMDLLRECVKPLGISNRDAVHLQLEINNAICDATIPQMKNVTVHCQKP